MSRPIRMTARIAKSLMIAIAALIATGSGARADLQLCSRMSYVLETAIAVEDKGAAATRGWFRLNPGQCRVVLQGTPPGDALYLHARALPVYGGSPLPQQGDADFCTAADNFVLAQARTCHRGNQQLARFTAVKPNQTEKGLVVYLAEDAEYTDEQARDAGIQRLLVIAGYDANPIDGIRGAKTDQALVQFFADNKLENTAAGRSDFFELLITAAQRPDGVGFAWCNDTKTDVMAALGVEDRGTVITRGWYRVTPGKCLRPDLTGKPRRLYSFGEAIGTDGQPLKQAPAQDTKPAAATTWGGASILCTRDVKFELSDHQDCAGKGLASTGFASIELGDSARTVVRFK
jgi:uncharacterized membrane protein